MYMEHSWKTALLTLSAVGSWASGFGVMFMRGITPFRRRTSPDLWLWCGATPSTAEVTKSACMWSNCGLFSSVTGEKEISLSWREISSHWTHPRAAHCCGDECTDRPPRWQSAAEGLHLRRWQSPDKWNYADYWQLPWTWARVQWLRRWPVGQKFLAKEESLARVPYMYICM